MLICTTYENDAHHIEARSSRYHFLDRIGEATRMLNMFIFVCCLIQNCMLLHFNNKKWFVNFHHLFFPLRVPRVIGLFIFYIFFKSLECSKSVDVMRAPIAQNHTVELKWKKYRQTPNTVWELEASTTGLFHGFQLTDFSRRQCVVARGSAAVAWKLCGWHTELRGWYIHMDGAAKTSTQQEGGHAAAAVVRTAAAAAAAGTATGGGNTQWRTQCTWIASNACLLALLGHRRRRPHRSAWTLASANECASNAIASMGKRTRMCIAFGNICVYYIRKNAIEIFGMEISVLAKVFERGPQQRCGH